MMINSNTTAIHNFEPYTHQAGGHCCILKFDGRLCKPLVQRECEFYRTIHKDVPRLATITPQFYGCVAVSPDKSSPHMLDYVSAKEHSSSLLEGSSNGGEHFQYYIVLQDLTAGMGKPCVMDIKMGTHRQRFDTSVELGLRICGMRVWRENGLYSVDRLFGRGLTRDTIEDAVGAFLFDGSSWRTELIPLILNKLQNIIAVVQHSPFRFYTSSLLFIYDGDEDSSASVDVRLVDFAHAIYKGTKGGEADDGFLFGMRNLVSLFTNILERHGVSSDSDSDMDSGDMSNSDVISTDEDVDSNNIPTVSGRPPRSRCSFAISTTSSSVEIPNSAGY